VLNVGHRSRGWLISLEVLAVSVSGIIVAENVRTALLFGAPFGVGDSAGNIRLNNNDYAAIRWVARHDGGLSRLWIKTRTVTHRGGR